MPREPTPTVIRRTLTLHISLQSLAKHCPASPCLPFPCRARPSLHDHFGPSRTLSDPRQHSPPAPSLHISLLFLASPSQAGPSLHEHFGPSRRLTELCQHSSAAHDPSTFPCSIPRSTAWPGPSNASGSPARCQVQPTIPPHFLCSISQSTAPPSLAQPYGASPSLTTTRSRKQTAATKAALPPRLAKPSHPLQSTHSIPLRLGSSQL
jgi:hypothetical protein